MVAGFVGFWTTALEKSVFPDFPICLYWDLDEFFPKLPWILIYCSCYLGRKNLKCSYKGFKMKCPYFDLKILILKCWLATSVLKSNKMLSVWINDCVIDFLKYLINVIGNLKKELSVAQLINCALLFPLLRKFVETLFSRQP